MARNFKPNTPYNIPAKILMPTYRTVKGVRKKAFSDPDAAPLIFISFRTFGGTETTENDLYTVYDTATVETWYRPDIKSDCGIYLCGTGETYEIKGKPENISMRNQYLRFKVEKVGET